MIPVTVLTGYLGAGKTTLLNRILTNRRGWKVAVIENEFGEIGVDQDLVIQSDEEMIVLNNGCVCCKIRGDLIRTLHDLVRKGPFDAVLIETTGLADPGPIAQSFFIDQELKSKLLLDAIVTLVDAKHVLLHLDSEAAAREQIAFADVVLLNKTDLVSADEAAALERRARALNAFATIHRVRNAEIPLEKILGIGAFDLSRKPEVHDDHEHDGDIRSVALVEPGALDGKRFNAWLGGLLKSKGLDIFRMKGIAEVAGEPRRVVFQGVHMMFDGRPDRPWEDGEDRTNRIVFIGRNLSRDELRAGLLGCVAG